MGESLRSRFPFSYYNKGMRSPSALPVLLTKLHIPGDRARWVRRERLFERLDQSLSVNLTLLSTPAGYGKTTLLAQWIADCGLKTGPATRSDNQPSQIADPQFCWLTLDEGDNDPVRFWSAFVAALRTCPAGQAVEDFGGGFLELLQSPQPAPIEHGLVLLLNALARFPSPLVLILDDFHTLTSHALLDGLSFFIDRMPAALHLILAGRGDPALPLARYRARGRILELHAAELRFTAGETSAYFQASSSLDLVPEDIAVFERRTEGWIAGLQLAALSLEGLEDPRAFIQSFSGDDRYILDYLTEEVLSRLPQPVLDFLLRTSVLERLSGDLCDELIAKREPINEHLLEESSRFSTSQSILEYLDSANLFLIPLDNTRTWYRYHRLFADLLQARLRRTRPEIIPDLHRKAAHWLLANGSYVEAFHHAVASGDLDLAAWLVGEALAGLVEGGEIVTLLAWIQAFPEAYIPTRPGLCLANAWANLYLVRFDQAEQWAVRASALLRPPPEDVSDWGQVEAIRATVAINHKDFARSIQLSQLALDHLPPKWGLARGLINLNQGDAQSVHGDFRAAIASHENALAAAQPYGNHTIDVIIIGSLGNEYLRLGRLRQAEAVLSQALLVEKDALADGDGSLPAGSYLVSLGKPLIYLSRIYLEWHRLEAAREMAGRALDYCRRWEHTDHLLDAWLAWAEVCQLTGDLAEMQRALDQAHEHVRRLGAHSGQVRSYSWSQRGVEMRLRLRQGDWDGLERLLAGFELHPGVEVHPHDVGTVALLGYTWLHAGRWDDARALGANLAGQAERNGWLRAQIQSQLLLALASQGLGDGSSAQAALARALHLAEPEGYVRLFLDAGKDLGLLMDDFRLKIAGANPAHLAYVDGLLRAFPKAAAAIAPRLEIKNQKINIAEPLSTREIQVLRLLAAGLTNDQIAAELILSTNTIKTHLKRIFEKLGVANRMEAANLAREKRWI